MTAPTQPVTVRLADFGGESLEGITVTARLSDVDFMADGTFVSTDPITAITDVDGIAVLNLFPNATAPTGLGTKGTVVRVKASLPHSRQLSVLAVIPNEPCSLASCIVSQEPSGLDVSQLAAADAQAARDLAKKWATQTDSEVEAGQGFGAQKYAQDAAGNAATTLANVTQTTADRTQTGLDRAQTGADRVQTGADRTAADASANAAATQAASVATAAATTNVYPNSASANVPRGLTQASVGTITGGSGGTNGTFALGFSGGTGWVVFPTGTFTVAGGAVTAVTITGPGLCISGTPAVPTVSFSASSGLTGAAVALTLQFLVTAGQGYWVTSADGQSLVRYKNVAGVATDDSAAIPALAANSSILDLKAKPVSGSMYAHYDGNGSAAMVVDNTGHSFTNVTAETLNGMKKAEMARRLRRQNMFFSSSIVHHIVYGQSLSLGQGGAVSTLPSVDGGFFDCLRFNANGTTWAGPRAQEGSGTAAQNHASLVPYLEQPLSGSTPTGNTETPLGNALRMIKRLLRDEDGINYTDFDYILLGSAPGQSNTSITGLSKTTVPYTNLIADVTYGLARAQELGKTYSVDVIHWVQGERDLTDGMTRATYLTKFQQLYTDLNADIKAITGQAHDIKIVSYQVTLAVNIGQNDVALAQLDAAKANPNIIIAAPVYAVEHLDPTQAHLPGIGYAHLGAYHGLAAKRVAIEGATWPTMYPRRFFRQGQILEAEWPDTGFPLAFSTTYFDQVANQGFSVVGVDGVTDNPIVSVSIVAPRRVRIVLTNALPGKLRYGFTSWGGNLHDTNSIDPGLPRAIPLYAPCLIFEEPFA